TGSLLNREPASPSLSAFLSALLTVQMMQNPQVLATLQERLDGLVEPPTGYIESLPRVVKRRVNALKILQVKCAQIEAKLYEEVHDLERKYARIIPRSVLHFTGEAIEDDDDDYDEEGEEADEEGEEEGDEENDPDYDSKIVFEREKACMRWGLGQS
uniref:Nucleosome assembly protein 1-like 1 n=1 Tax=Neovison vison TaxID=452646 RepID=A0A8C7A8H9_NEOVI